MFPLSGETYNESVRYSLLSKAITVALLDRTTKYVQYVVPLLNMLGGHVGPRMDMSGNPLTQFACSRPSNASGSLLVSFRWE